MLQALKDFPGYWISSDGSVKNERRSYPLSRLVNNTGAVYVSLYQDGKAYNRSLARLVAEAFLPEPESEAFDTPINLNGNRMDCRLENLMWRPYWFARAYFKQFHNNQRGYNCPVELLDTGERFNTSWEAAVKYGLLDRDILVKTMNHEQVWPAMFTFRPLLRTPYRHV